MPTHLLRILTSFAFLPLPTVHRNSTGDGSSSSCSGSMDLILSNLIVSRALSTEEVTPESGLEDPGGKGCVEGVPDPPGSGIQMAALDEVLDEVSPCKPVSFKVQIGSPFKHQVRWVYGEGHTEEHLGPVLQIGSKDLPEAGHGYAPILLSAPAADYQNQPDVALPSGHVRPYAGAGSGFEHVAGQDAVVAQGLVPPADLGVEPLAIPPVTEAAWRPAFLAGHS